MIGDYTNGWRPESALRQVADDMLNIIFSKDANGYECDMALSTLWEAMDPARFAKTLPRIVKPGSGSPLTPEEIADVLADEDSAD